MKVGIYARVSTDSQAERQTIDAQLDACHTHCQRNGYEVTASFKEEGVSGAIPFDQRAEGGRLLAAARDGLFTSVVIYSVDRLGRDVVEGVIAHQELAKAGAPAEFVSQSFDDTPEGEFMFNTFLNVAQLERAVIRRQMMTGQQRRLREGRKGRGRTPFGYHWNAESGQFDVAPDEADVVRSIYALYAGGALVKAIAITLTESGTPSPDGQRGHKAGAARWQGSAVHRILTRPYYSTGTMTGTFLGEEYALSVPKLISEALYGEVKARRGAARHFGRRRGSKGLFQALIACGSCGRTYHRGGHGKGQPPAYTCPGRLTETQRAEGTGKCLSPTLNLPDTDERLWKGLVAALRDPKALSERFLAGVEGEIAAADVGEQVELDDLRARRDYAFEQLARPGGSLAAIQRTIIDLDKQIKRAETRLHGKEAEVARLQLLQAQRHNLLQVLQDGQSAMMEVRAYGKDPRGWTDSLVPLKPDDDLTDWLAGEREVVVTLAGGVDLPPEFVPVNAWRPAAEMLSRRYKTTADVLLDYLGVRATVLPDGRLELVGTAIYWADTATLRYPRRRGSPPPPGAPGTPRAPPPRPW